MTVTFVRMCFATIVVVCATTITQAQAPRSDANLLTQDRQAQKLLKLVIAGRPQPGRCQYNTDWDRAELDAYEARIIRGEMGITFPSKAGDFRAIVNFDHHADAAAFCTDSELKSYTAERIAEFENSSAERMQIDRTLFRYPVFNRSRTKAVVIVTYLARDGRYRSSGKIYRHTGGAGVEARFYRKVGGS